MMATPSVRLRVGEKPRKRVAAVSAMGVVGSSTFRKHALRVGKKTLERLDRPNPVLGRGMLDALSKPGSRGDR
jgi:hypothetical protein